MDSEKEEEEEEEQELCRPSGNTHLPECSQNSESTLMESEGIRTRLETPQEECAQVTSSSVEKQTLLQVSRCAKTDEAAPPKGSNIGVSSSFQLSPEPPMKRKISGPSLPMSEKDQELNGRERADGEEIWTDDTKGRECLVTHRQINMFMTH